MRFITIKQYSCCFSSSCSSVAAHAVDAVLAVLAPVVAHATMPLVVRQVDALPAAASLRVLALLLARAAVVVVILQVHALVVAACRVLPRGKGVAHVVVLVAVIGGSRVPRLLGEEATHPLGRQ